MTLYIKLRCTVCNSYESREVESSFSCEDIKCSSCGQVNCLSIATANSVGIHRRAYKESLEKLALIRQI